MYLARIFNEKCVDGCVLCENVSTKNCLSCEKGKTKFNNKIFIEKRNQHLTFLSSNNTTTKTI